MALSAAKIRFEEGDGKAAPAEGLGISVVVPIHNERGNLRPLHAELTHVLGGLGRDYEILYVDDGSSDGSTGILREIAATDPCTRVVIFRRNYGQTSAMLAGINLASHDAIVTIDGDLQNDPADIPAMVRKLEEGYDLVHGWRKDRQDALLSRKIPSRIANRLVARLMHFPIHDLGCTLKVMRRSIVQEIELYGAMHRFVPILMHQRGARCVEVVTNHRPRGEGESKYGMWRVVTVLLDLLTVKYMLDYSAHPMRLFGGLGLICWLIALLSLGVTIMMKIAGVMDMTGNPLLLMSVMAGLAGLQLLSLGVLSEISARIYYAHSDKTHYAVREKVNFPEAPAPAESGSPEDRHLVASGRSG
jgi:glycosyltransferase involved in cell wall biosynthesis